VFRGGGEGACQLAAVGGCSRSTVAEESVVSHKLDIMSLVTGLNTVDADGKILRGRTCRAFVKIVHGVTYAPRYLVQTLPSFDGFR